MVARVTETREVMSKEIKKLYREYIVPLLIFKGVKKYSEKDLVLKDSKFCYCGNSISQKGNFCEDCLLKVVEGIDLKGLIGSGEIL